VPVIGLLAVIGGAEEPDSAIAGLIESLGNAGPTRGRATETSRGAPSALQPLATRPSDSANEATSVRATPLARRLAGELGLDLRAVRGSGPGGRVIEADVRASTAVESQGASSVDQPGRARTAAVPVLAPGDAGNLAGAGTDGHFVRASPLARRLAREQGIELNSIDGSGPERRVLERDVLARAATNESAAPDVRAPRRVETIKVSGIRRLIAERMLRSLQSSAQLTLTTEVDATELVDLRSHLLPAARVYGHRPPTYTDMLLQLVARLLPAHPLLNSSLLGEGEAQEIACWADITVGVAVALERGLVVPVVRHADQKSLDAISAELSELVARARSNTLTTDDLQGATFTLTNLGALEIDGFTPIINPPQCAILGIGRIAAKPAVHQGQIVIRQLLTLSLTFDHRILDGAPAGAFLRDVKRAIEGVSAGPPA
ncbi:MAG TPA: 2-oxo acid dehydrogenase subunit E2, partial [Chloroflexota bacterium]